jgi:chromate transporter
MSATPILTMQWMNWLSLFAHYLELSALSVGGALATAPEMHRYLVVQQHWLSEVQFNSSIAIAQAAPGPNVLFVALLGWNIGLNAGGGARALLGVFITMTGILLPSSTLCYFAAHWLHRNRELRAVRAFRQGMGPIVVALVFATGWILAKGHGNPATDWRLWLLTAATVLILWRCKIHLLWLLAAGAILGWFGVV